MFSSRQVSDANILNCSNNVQAAQWLKTNLCDPVEWVQTREPSVAVTAHDSFGIQIQYTSRIIREDYNAKNNRFTTFQLTTYHLAAQIARRFNAKYVF